MQHEIDKHMIGFEKEAALEKLWAHPDVRKRLFYWSDFKAVAWVLCPELIEGAFDRRPCERTLRYNQDPEVLVPGELEACQYAGGNIYHSIDFNGATYTIKETGSVTGRAWFTIVDEP